MNILSSYITRLLGYFLLLLFIQFLVLEKVNIFYGYIVPSIYFYILLWIPLSVSMIWLLIIAFLLGSMMDILHLSTGIYSFACVNVAFFKTSIYKNLNVFQDRYSITKISISNLGVPKYLLYLLIMTSIYFLSTTILEWFSLDIFQYYFMIKWVSDIITSISLIILIDFITLRFRQNAYF
ncbi:MAG: hypothetical protein ACRC0A_06370 [Chitinophagaceae bacterium]